MLSKGLFLIGQAPGPHPRHDPERHALFPYPPGCAGHRLYRMTGLTRAQYIAIPRRNVIPYWPGRGRVGDKFPVGEAKERAREMLPALVGHSVLFVGKATAAAFGFFSRGVLDPGTDDDRMLTWVPCRVYGHEFEAACVPHPSGLNRWYNDADNRDAALAFVRLAALEHVRVVEGREPLQRVVRHRERRRA